MKFNPLTRELFTDDNVFIKKVKCPYLMTWEELKETSNGNKECARCKQEILNTEDISDDLLLKYVQKNPDSCIKISLDQPNISIIAEGYDRL